MTPSIKLTVLCFLLASGLFSSRAQANVGDAYGIGSQSGALGGAGVAGPFDGFSAYNNPAGVATDKAHRITFSYGLLYAVPTFTKIDDVVVSNRFTSDTQVRGSVDNSYRSTFGQVLGASFRLAPKTLNLSGGLSVFSPLEQVAYLDSGAVFQPEYVMYRGRTQRPQIDLALGAELSPAFFMGVGIHFGYAVTSNADVMLQTSTNTASSLRLASTLKPKASPYFGFYLAPEGAPVSFGLTTRLPLSSTNDMTLKNSSRVFGNLAALDFNLKAYSTLFYDPLTFELGTQIQEAEVGRTLLQVEYQRWSDYEAPSLAIQDPSITSCSGGCPLAIQPSKNPSYITQDLWVPKVGQELFFGDTTARVGYSYRGSIFKTLPSGSGNYLDPPKHIFTGGLGFKFATLLGQKVPCRLDTHATIHLLKSETITKTSGNEVGTASDEKIGYPGYKTGGAIYGGGVSLTVEL